MPTVMGQLRYRICPGMELPPLGILRRMPSVMTYVSGKLIWVLRWEMVNLYPPETQRKELE